MITATFCLTSAITIEKTEALSTHVRTSPQDGLARRAGQYRPFCPSRIAVLGRGIRKKLSPKVRPNSFKATFACPARRGAWTLMWSPTLFFLTGPWVSLLEGLLRYSYRDCIDDWCGFGLDYCASRDICCSMRLLLSKK